LNRRPARTTRTRLAPLVGRGGTNRGAVLLSALLLSSLLAAFPGARDGRGDEGAPHPAAVPKEQATGMGRNLRLSEPVTLLTLSGPVLAVTQEETTLYVTLREGADNVYVQLGPAAYIAGKKVTVAAGDAVEVKGARAFLASGRKAIVATDLYKGGVRVKLREEDGSPLWGLKGGCRNCKGGAE
jgi:hypothetical protein